MAVGFMSRSEQPSSETHLWVCSGEQIGKRFALDGAQHRIGRNADLEIQVDDGRASGRHAKIDRVDGKHFVTDLGSTNKTFVNNREIHGPTELKDGDLIQIGETVFEYVSYGDRNITINVPGASSGQAPNLQMPAATPMAPGSPLVPVQRPAPGNFGMQHTQGHYPNAMGYPMQYTEHRGMYPDEEQEAGFDLQELIQKIRTVLAFFLPYWRSILAISLLAAVLGASSLFLSPPPETAVFDITLIPDVADGPLGRVSNNVAFFKSAEQSFRSRHLISETLTKLGEPQPSAEQIAVIMKHLKFASIGPPSPNTYHGSYTNVSGEKAKTFLRAHVNTFLDTEIEKILQVIKSNRDFLAKQLDATEAELKATENELLGFKKGNIDGLPDQARQNYDLLFRLQQEKQQVEMNLIRTRAQRKLLGNRLSTENKTIEGQRMTVSTHRQAIARLRQEIAAARAAGKGAAHPDVVRMNDELANLRRLARAAATDPNEANSIENPNYRRIENELSEQRTLERTTRTELHRLNQEIARVQRVVAKLPELEAKHAELTRSYASNQDKYERLLQQLNAVTLQLEFERASAAARYNVISDPEVEYTSRVQLLVKRGLIAGVVGFMLALLLTAVRQLRHHPAFQPPPPVAITPDGEAASLVAFGGDAQTPLEDPSVPSDPADVDPKP